MVRLIVGINKEEIECHRALVAKLQETLCLFLIKTTELSTKVHVKKNLYSTIRHVCTV
jgi:hypothetical protein